MILASQIRIIFQNKELNGKDRRDLAVFGIRNDDSLDLRLRIKGGSNSSEHLQHNNENNTSGFTQELLQTSAIFCGSAEADKNTNLKMELSGDDIDLCLRSLYKDCCFYVHPNLGSISNLFSTLDNEAEDAAFNFIQQIMNIKQDLMPNAKFEDVLVSNPSLDRPLLTILNTKGKSQSVTDVDSHTTLGSHWVALIILPRFLTQAGEEIAERVYLYDSIHSDRSIPVTLIKY